MEYGEYRKHLPFILKKCFSTFFNWLPTLTASVWRSF